MTKIHLEHREEGVRVRFSSDAPALIRRHIQLLKECICADHLRYSRAAKAWLIDPAADNDDLDNWLETAESYGGKIQWSFAEPTPEPRQPAPNDAVAVMYFRFFGRSSRSTETH
jgi:hypothetical protein